MAQLVLCKGGGYSGNSCFYSLFTTHKWGLSKLGVPFWGVPTIKIVVLWGVYWGLLILGNDQVGSEFRDPSRAPHR